MTRDRGVTRRRRLFTEAEDLMLRTHWGAGTSMDDLLNLFPGRRQETLYARAALIGLPKRDFRKAAVQPRGGRASNPELGYFRPSLTEEAFVRKVRALGGYPYAILDGPERGTVTWPFERPTA